MGFRVAAEAWISARPAPQAGPGARRSRWARRRRVRGRSTRISGAVREGGAGIALRVAAEASTSAWLALHGRGRRLLAHGGAVVNARAT
jgi:hypothetical protein